MMIESSNLKKKNAIWCELFWTEMSRFWAACATSTGPVSCHCLIDGAHLATLSTENARPQKLFGKGGFTARPHPNLREWQRLGSSPARKNMPGIRIMSLPLSNGGRTSDQKRFKVSVYMRRTEEKGNNLGHFLKTAEQVFFGVSGGAKFHLHFHGFSGNTLTRFFPSSMPQKMEMESARTTLPGARENPTLGRAKSFTADEFGIRKHLPGPKPSPNLKAIQNPCEKWYLNSWSLWNAYKSLMSNYELLSLSCDDLCAFRESCHGHVIRVPWFWSLAPLGCHHAEKSSETTTAERPLGQVFSRLCISSSWPRT